jgi:threonine dehydrogenase-like Zn-dependent dehydrogenase
VKLDLNSIWYQEVDLIGSKGHGMDEWRGERRHSYDWAVRWIREGKLTGNGLITHRFRFEDYKRAVATSLDKRDAKSIKVIFEYR